MKRDIKKFISLCIFIINIFASAAYAADVDHDGIEDNIDMCPNTTQLKMVDSNFKYAITVDAKRLQKGPKAWPVMANGCEPDVDHDGVINSMDFCPQDTTLAISKGVAKNGCPIHSDSDGTPDFRDQCPGTVAGIPTDKEGCPLKGSNNKKRDHVASRIQKLFKQ